MPVYARCSWYTIVNLNSSSLRRPYAIAPFTTTVQNCNVPIRAPLLTIVIRKPVPVAHRRFSTPHPALSCFARLRFFTPLLSTACFRLQNRLIVTIYSLLCLDRQRWCGTTSTLGAHHVHHRTLRQTRTPRRWAEILSSGSEMPSASTCCGVYMLCYGVLRDSVPW